MAPQTKKRKIETIKTNLHQIGDDCMLNIYSFLSDSHAFKLFSTCKQFYQKKLMDLNLNEFSENFAKKFDNLLNTKYCEEFRIVKIDKVNDLNAKQAKKLMEKCSNVTELSFEASGGKFTIPKLSNLKKLAIGGEEASVEFGAEIPSLKSLKLAMPIKSVKEIVNLYPNLEELEITFAGNDLSPLKSLPLLKSLHIRTTHLLKSSLNADQIYETISIPVLETFILDMNGPISLCSPFVKRKVTCPQLKTLHIFNNQNFMEEDELEEIGEDEDFDAFIFELVKSNFPKLENIRLKFGSIFGNLDPLVNNESLANIKSLELIDVSYECFEKLCSIPFLKGLTKLECKIDMGLEEESQVFKKLAEYSFENLKSLKISYQEFAHTEKGFKEFCSSDKFSNLEILHLGIQIGKKDNLLLPKSTSFPNLKSLFIEGLEGNMKSFLTTFRKNESFGKLEEFNAGESFEIIELQNLKKCFKRLTKVITALSSEDERDDSDW